jgi:hypothetical protein
MKVATYEGVVENGQIKLSEASRLPEHAKTYVVVAVGEEVSEFHVGSPRLAQPERAGDFAKEVVNDWTSATRDH